VAAFYKLALAPKLERASELQTQIAASETKLAAAKVQAQTLQSVKRNYAADYTSLVGLGKAVPADDDVRSLLVQVNTAAKRSGVDFRTITLDSGAAAATPAPDATGSAAATQTAASALPPGAIVGAAGLPTMPFSFEFEGSFFEMSEFMSRLERFVVTQGDGLRVRGRLLTVDGFSFVPSDKGFPSMKASLGATAYLVNPADGATGGATATGPVAAGAPPAAATPTPPRATKETGNTP
jgi:Tfp pilus assembly protein PilO